MGLSYTSTSILPLPFHTPKPKRRTPFGSPYRPSHCHYREYPRVQEPLQTPLRRLPEHESIKKIVPMLTEISIGMTRTVVKIFLYPNLVSDNSMQLVSHLCFRARYVVSSFILNFKVLSEVPGFWEFNFARLDSFLHWTIAIMPRTDDV